MQVTEAFTQWVKRLSPQDDAPERGPDAATAAGSEPAAGLAGG